MRARALAAPLLSAAIVAGCGGGADPLEGAKSEPVSGPLELIPPALLEDVALEHHDGYDRAVFEFRNHLPGYRIEYVEPPLREEGSGRLLKVAGSAHLVVRMATASGGIDLSTGKRQLVYFGPARIPGSQAGTAIVREVVRTGDFLDVMSWAVGLEDRVDFRVLTLAEPPRLVVDFRDH